jgi:muconolactone delta-isomerase
MRMMVTMVFDTSRRAEIVARVPAERERIRELTAQGIVEALYVAAPQDRVWLVLRAGTEDEARQAAESLPLHSYALLDYATLADLM